MNSISKLKLIVPLLVAFAIALTPVVGAQDWDRDGDNQLVLIGVIGIPGNPISSTDIVWVDQATERLYFTDRGNGPTDTCPLTEGAKTHGAVDVIDAENDLFIGRITIGTINKSPVCFAGANSVDRNLGG